MGIFRRKRRRYIQSHKPYDIGVDQETRLRVYKRDRYRCVYCDSSERLQIDHVHPRHHGGSNHIKNLVTACQSCNQAKGARLIEGRTVKDKVRAFRDERQRIRYLKSGKKTMKPKRHAYNPVFPLFPRWVKWACLLFIVVLILT